MAVFIIRARLGVGIAGPGPTFTYPSTPYFTDATAGSEFAFPWIQRMKLESITSGCTATTYCPTDPVTRGEMAIFIMRGAFNQFLPAGTPVITSISPSTLPVGTSGTYTITGTNTNFVQGTTQLSPIPGVTIGTITVNSATSMTVQLTAAPNAVAQPYSILAITGTRAGCAAQRAGDSVTVAHIAGHVNPHTLWRTAGREPRSIARIAMKKESSKLAEESAHVRKDGLPP